jgi:arylsulfatase A-like enzyme
MCDSHLGKVLDMMDRYDMWDDTMLIVNTDHGFLLGEHGWWAKCVQPFYEEIAHTPLFIWDPRSGRRDVHNNCLVQTIDLAPTLLEYFGIELPADMQGVPLRETIASDTAVRDAALFGLHGGHVNVTDGRFVYMRAPATADNAPLFNYTLMPTHMRQRFDVAELQDFTLAEPFSFTKNCQTMKVPARAWPRSHPFQTHLFDLENDPHQHNPIEDPDVEAAMIEHVVREMLKNEAPPEQFVRLGLLG